ncbi:TROVE domain-containing protein [uncultured Dokdonia sp.]|uniref:TROVE domain-containing protein n=1 Tax=uncultured Dokdonia sp. TaxID=575653 RepID=UPI002615FB2E|nr:TROVE domain-containing protein [uncultured Dokdonia sp.]
MKFNVFTKTKKQVKNYEGAKAYRLTPKMELYTAVVNSTLEKTSYEKGQDRLQRIIDLIQKNDPYFVAQLAVYARQKMYLRSIPIVLAVELSKIHSGDNLVSRTVNGVIQRADEITELLAYYQVANQRTGTKKLNKLSKQVQKGIVMALNKFDAYQFAKYNRQTEVTFKDAIFLTHPKAKDDAQQAIFNHVIQDTLEAPYTWEVELSKLGQQSFKNAQEKQKALTAQWETLIDSKKLGYMALMRNLRNILQADVSAVHISKIADTLTDPYHVKRSKQFPFRFMAAYQELMSIKSSYTPYLLEALETAIKISVENIKGFDLDTKVVIACDVSGSMMQPISAKSKIQAYDIGLVLGMLLQHKSDNIITGLFGDRWKRYILPKGDVLSNVMKLKSIEGEVGYSTNGYKVIQDLNSKKRIVDKVMIFTDCQLWNSGHYNSDAHIATEWKQYKRIAPNAKLYIFDLMGYKNAPLNITHDDVHLIGGWSDKIFEVLDAIENGASAIQHIQEQSL